MVAKNSGSGKPQPNVGATLFIRSSGSPQNAPQNAPLEVDQKKTTVSPQVLVSECRARTWNANSEARISRERRLMAHLGLKGTAAVYDGHSLSSRYSAESAWLIRINLSGLNEFFVTCAWSCFMDLVIKCTCTVSMKIFHRQVKPKIFTDLTTVIRIN